LSTINPLLRILRRLPTILHDMGMVTLAWVLAISLRYDLPLEPTIQQIFLQALPIVVIVQSIVLWYYALYQSIWRFTSMPDFVIILRSVIVGTLAIALTLVLFNRLEGIPRTSLLFYPFLLGFLLGVPRIFYRLWHEHSLKFLLTTQTNQRVLVLGAGTSGDMLVRDVVRNPACGYIPVGFLDDNHRLHNGKVQGLPVFGGIERVLEIVETEQVDFLVIAMPAATDEQMRRVVELCEQCSIPFRTLPKLDDVVNGQVKLNNLRDVAIEDLLGREKVHLDWHLIKNDLQGKSVMVSGGGGSIGSELCQQIARLNPSALIIFERCEFNLYQVEMHLRQIFPSLTLHAYLGDITDAVAVNHVLNTHQPEVIFHAAAYKHVPLLQFQAREALRNNVFGTQMLAKAAISNNCQVFVMISTDKAVNPSSIMGTTKRLAEMFCQALNERADTRFIIVRFGNVLGSAGSVVPLFKTQIAQGGPVTVTHAEMNRYFMTIPEACQLILQASVMGKGGEIFVLDMGKPVQISYLAEQMIRLSGKVPEQDIKIIYTGLRPGEKLHEELFHADELLGKTQHAKILLARNGACDWTQVNDCLEQLDKACACYAETEIQQLLQTFINHPNNGSLPQ
jgi:FlaA1/EpsC-like NDP-sugar epimerase